MDSEQFTVDSSQFKVAFRLSFKSAYQLADSDYIIISRRFGRRWRPTTIQIARDVLDIRKRICGLTPEPKVRDYNIIWLARVRYAASGVPLQ